MNNQYLQHTKLPAFICLCHYWHEMPLHQALFLLADFINCPAFPNLTETEKYGFQSQANHKTRSRKEENYQTLLKGAPTWQIFKNP